MDSLLKSASTPRRSVRLQRAESPAADQVDENKKVGGPRSLAKLEKSQKILNNEEKKADEESTSGLDSAAASLSETKENSTKSQKAAKKTRRGKKATADSEADIQPLRTSSSEFIVIVPEEVAAAESETTEEPQKVEMAKSARKEKKNKQAEKMLEPQEKPKTEKIVEPLAAVEPAQAAGSHEEVAEKHLEDESMLMDPSMLMVAVDPPKEFLSLSPIAPLARPAKDSTFSPVVDTSIHDARPNIDTTLGAENIFETPKASVSSSRTSNAAVALRTSTPFAQKLNLCRTSKGSTPAASPLVKNATLPVEAAEDDSVEFKPVNALEKSILKSSRRKRSMSVADGESLMQKRVMFNSPKFMEIEKIDVKMMASFIEEKENSVMKKNKDAHRRRSHSIGSGTPSKQKERPQSRPKMPNFKAIHEQQFEKMESIADHAQRKAERAKKLTTPSREVEAKRPKLQAISRIPKRQGMKQKSPTSAAPSVAGASKSVAGSSKAVAAASVSVTGSSTSVAGASKSVAGASKSVAGSSKAVTAALTSVTGASTSGLQRSSSGSTWAPKVQVTAASFLGPKKDVGTSSGIAQKNNKVEDRRVKNMALFKGKVVLDARAKNGALLKGVRLNRRFELQMHHRRNTDDK